MKAIMMSDKPKYCASMMNRDKTVEVRTTCPKDWKDYLSGKTKVKPEPRIVFLYCTMSGDRLLEITCGNEVEYKFEKECDVEDLEMSSDILNSKVIAKFTLNTVEEAEAGTRDTDIPEVYQNAYTNYHDFYYLLKSSCLYSPSNLLEYLGYDNDYSKPFKKKFYAWHIDNLVIFDESKELSEFKHLVKYRCNKCPYNKYGVHHECTTCEEYVPLIRPFQSWGYVEV